MNIIKKLMNVAVIFFIPLGVIAGNICLLTNKDGKTIDAEVLFADKNQVEVRMNKRTFTIPFSTLDQKTVKMLKSMIPDESLVSKTRSPAKHLINFFQSKYRWTIVSVSSESSREPAWKAIDGNPRTYWHSYYKTLPRPKHPHTIVVDMRSLVEIDVFYYIGRNDGGPHQENGRIIGYEVQFSKDGKTWGNEIAGKFENHGEPQIVRLPENVIARYFKFTALSGRTKKIEDEGYDLASAAELDVHIVKELSPDTSFTHVLIEQIVDILSKYEKTYFFELKPINDNHVKFLQALLAKAKQNEDGDLIVEVELAIEDVKRNLFFRVGIDNKTPERELLHKIKVERDNALEKAQKSSWMIYRPQFSDLEKKLNSDKDKELARDIKKIIECETLDIIEFESILQSFQKFEHDSRDFFVWELIDAKTACSFHTDGEFNGWHTDVGFQGRGKWKMLPNGKISVTINKGFENTTGKEIKNIFEKGKYTFEFSPNGDKLYFEENVFFGVL